MNFFAGFDPHWLLPYWPWLSIASNVALMTALALMWLLVRRRRAMRDVELDDGFGMEDAWRDQARHEHVRAKHWREKADVWRAKYEAMAAGKCCHGQSAARCRTCHPLIAVDAATHVHLGPAPCPKCEAPQIALASCGAGGCGGASCDCGDCGYCLANGGPACDCPTCQATTQESPSPQADSHTHTTGSGVWSGCEVTQRSVCVGRDASDRAAGQWFARIYLYG